MTVFLVFRGLETLSYTPPESKDPNVVFIPYPWKGIPLSERSARVGIADVNIPARVAVRVEDTIEYFKARRSKAANEPEAKGANPQDNKRQTASGVIPIGFPSGFRRP